MAVQEGGVDGNAKKFLIPSAKSREHASIKVNKRG